MASILKRGQQRIKNFERKLFVANVKWVTGECKFLYKYFYSC